MFGDLLGNLQQQQEEMRKKLAQVNIEAEVADGAVVVKANGNKEILDVKIDPEKLDWNDQEQVLDLIIAAVNRAIETASDKEKEEAQQMMQNMLPPGLGNLFG